MTNKRLQELSQQHSSDITRMFQQLVEKGFLLTNNKVGRGTVYHLNKNYNMDSVIKESNSVIKEGSSVIKEYNSNDKLLKITEPSRKNKRLSSDVMSRIITDACSIEPLSLQQLAKLLNRKSESLRILYLSNMVKNGQIKLLYPDEPNHPNQAYLIK